LVSLEKFVHLVARQEKFVATGAPLDRFMEGDLCPVLKAFIVWPSEFPQVHEAMEARKDKGDEEFVVVVIGWPELGYDGV
jgi:hypothetical protein